MVKVTRTEPIVKHTHHQAMATTDNNEVASSLDRGSIGTLNQIDELMRKSSSETPTPLAHEAAKNGDAKNRDANRHSNGEAKSGDSDGEVKKGDSNCKTKKEGRSLD